MPQIIRKMTFSRRGLFMPLNLAIAAAVVPESWDVEIIDENIKVQSPSILGTLSSEITLNRARSRAGSDHHWRLRYLSIG